MTMNAESPNQFTAASRHLGNCRHCGAELTHSVTDLGKSPLCETFLTPEQTAAAEYFFPLHAVVCDQCWLVQVKEYNVPADLIFTDHYPYYSSFSTSWVEHARKYCEMITARLGLGEKKLVVELACNDGYLLQHFPKYGVTNIVGVEPSGNVAEEASKKGIPVIVDFFGAALAQRIRDERGAAELVLGNNVLAHVPALNDFVAGVKILLAENGVATFEFPHLQNLIEQNQFDTIYHEHFCYFSAIAIEAIAKKHGLVFFDVEEIPTHGGSLRVYLAHEGREVIRQSVRDIIAREEGLGYKTVALYEAYEEKVKETKRKLLTFLIEAKNAGKKVVGYGAPGKGNTLLNYCGIGPDLIDFTVDRNHHKHGRYTPGTHIPVLPVEALDAAKPDYVLILPWNLRKEISAQMKHIGQWGGKFVIPIPEATVFDP